jgi:hypothetical protein
VILNDNKNDRDVNNIKLFFSAVHEVFFCDVLVVCLGGGFGVFT